METGIKNRVSEFIAHKGITIKEFELRCGLSNGYINAMRKGFGRGKLNNVLTEFPELNREWLLYGEGDMLTDSPSTNRHDEATQLDNEVRTPTLDTAINEISKQRKLVEHSQQQIDRLITIIEKLSGSQTG